MTIQISPIGTYASGAFDESAAEIVKFDEARDRLLVVNGDSNGIDVLDISDPTNPTLVDSIDVAAAIGDDFGGVNSVDVDSSGVIIVAVANADDSANGFVAAFASDLSFDQAVTVGVGPDMVTYTPDENTILVANEGEPDGDNNPEGSISIIDISADTPSVTTLDFSQFNGQEDALREAGVIIGPDLTAAQAFEPEFIAVSPDGTTARVTLQENNALLVIDLTTNTITGVQPLGTVDFATLNNALDPSNDDTGIVSRNGDVEGLRNPDAIASYEVDGQTYFVIANEGDAADDDVSRIRDLTLDPTVFPDAATFQMDENFGRLEVQNTLGDTDGDGDYDALFAIGARSFSILDVDGNIVFDSGNDFEQITAALLPEGFNSTNDDNDSVDNRSDDGGPEPEGVTVGQVGDNTYAFIALERIGGIMVYNVTDPANAFFVDYVNNRDFTADAETAAALDLGPEGLEFISAEASPNGNPLLAVGNEVSGTTTVFEVTEPETFTLQILHASDLEGGVDAITNAPNFAAIVDRLEDTYANSVLLSAGDNIIPGPFFNAAGDREAFRDSGVFNDTYNTLFGTDEYDSLREGGGRVDISIMNILGFDASAIGNHEFDAGSDALEQVIEEDFRSPDGPESDRWVGAQFPYLSGNLDFTNDGDLGNLFTDDILPNTAFQTGPDQSAAGNTSVPKIAQATTIEEGGELIGVVGATTQLIESISSPGASETTGGANDMAALAAVLNPIIADLADGDDDTAGTADDVNKIILVSHLQQFSLEQELATLLNGVDVIIAGGSDTLLADSEDRLRAGDVADADYPFLTTNADGDPIAVVSTDGEYSYVGRLVVEFDADGVLIPGSIDENVSGAFATDEQGVTDVTGAATAAEGVAASAKATEVQKLVDAVSDVVTSQDGNVFGETDVFLDGRRSEVRTEETNFGNLTADANLATAQFLDPTVQVSLKNGGGIRSAIGEVDSETGDLLPPQENPLSGKQTGEISQLDIDNALRFNNALTLITLTPEQLLEVLEHAVAATGDGNTPGQFAQVGGISFSFDDDLPVGERVQNVSIIDEDGNFVQSVVVNGTVVSDTPIRVVTLNFLADGGDGYPYADFVAADPEFANRVDLTGEPLDDNGNGMFDPFDPDEDFNLNGVQDGPALTLPGNATFATTGTEQDALAEFLIDNFPIDGGTPFNDAETDPADDTRIQNLDFADDTVIPAEGLTIAAIVANAAPFDTNPDDFDILLAVLELADLLPALNGLDDALTVVAPTDGAFLARAANFGYQGTDEEEAVEVLVEGLTALAPDDPIGLLTNILLYHVSPTEQTLAELQTNETITTLLTGATFTVSGNSITDNDPDSADANFVDGATDIAAVNGQIQVIDAVLLPADVTPVDVVTAAIFDIQGAGHVSEHVGEVVNTSGIVTAVDFSGFFVQDPDGDGDDETSDGIFVFTGSAPTVSVGDAITFSGTVSEFIPGGAGTGNLSITQINSIENLVVVSSGNALPTASIIGQGGRVPPAVDVISDDELPTSLTDPATANLNFDPANDGIDFFESLEGMLVTVESPVVVGPTNRFDETWLLANNGEDADPQSALNDRGGIDIQADADGLGDLNPERVQIEFETPITPDAAEQPLNLGDQLTDVTGVVNYSFGNFEIYVTEEFDVEESGLQPETTTIAGDEDTLTVAAYNVLNLSAASGDDEQRDALAEHIVTNLNAPDIIALQEIQDNSGGDDDGGEGDGVLEADETLQALVDAIEAAGGPTYAFASAEVDEDGETGGEPGGNIRNAYLWNPERTVLDSVDGIETLETEELVALGGIGNGDTNPFNEANARDPLLATFEFNGREVKLINNHFESRSGSDPIFGANQPFEQGGEQAREDASQVINNVVDTLIAEDPDVKVAVLGDLNTFEFTDDVAEILSGTGDEKVLNNLIDDPAVEGEKYTFNFQGNSQVLDHILVTDTLLPNAEVDIVHVNVDFANGTPGVASDHEPVLAGLQIEQAPDTLEVVYEFSEARFDHAFGWYNTDTGDAAVLFESTRALRNDSDLSTAGGLSSLEDRTAEIDLTEQSFDDLEFFLIVAESGTPLGSDFDAETSAVSVDRTEGRGMVDIDGMMFDAFFTETNLNRDGQIHALALSGEDRATDSIDPEDATLDQVRDDGPVGLLAFEDLLGLGDSDFEDAVFTITGVSDAMV